MGKKRENEPQQQAAVAAAGAAVIRDRVYSGGRNSVAASLSASFLICHHACPAQIRPNRKAILRDAPHSWRGNRTETRDPNNGHTQRRFPPFFPYLYSLSRLRSVLFRRIPRAGWGRFSRFSRTRPEMRGKHAEIKGGKSSIKGFVKHTYTRRRGGGGGLLWILGRGVRMIA